MTYRQWVTEGEMAHGLVILNATNYSDRLKVAEIITWSKIQEQRDILEALDEALKEAKSSDALLGLVAARKLVADRLGEQA
jgi:hypothetical protein